jgi:hypothetical protein
MSLSDAETLVTAIFKVPSAWRDAERRPLTHVQCAP